MKRIMCFICLTCSAAMSHAQTLGEWFDQGNTQRQYLIQQIAAFQVYLGYVKKGYAIAKSGLTTISDLKKGDLNLHTDFFNSLKSINPEIKNYARVADIIALQLNMVKVYKKALKNVQQSGQFNSGEVDYIGKVFSNLLDACTENIDELIAVTTTGRLEMKDDERLKRIDHIYEDMADKYSFEEHFCKQTELLALQRSKENNDIETGKLLNYIK